LAAWLPVPQVGQFAGARCAADEAPPLQNAQCTLLLLTPGRDAEVDCDDIVDCERFADVLLNADCILLVEVIALERCVLCVFAVVFERWVLVALFRFWAAGFVAVLWALRLNV